LTIWSYERSDQVICSVDDITWFDRALLSGNDTQMHRSPRCAGVFQVGGQWKLFNHDPTYKVYVTSFPDDRVPTIQEVRSNAYHVMPVALPEYVPRLLTLQGGMWHVGIGRWMLRLCVSVSPPRPEASTPGDRDISTLKGGKITPPSGRPAYSAAVALPDAVAKVGKYLEQNAVARMAIAYYYREFIRNRYERYNGSPIDPQAVPMLDVAIALDLNSEGSVSEFKRELQRRIWGHGGRHQRDLAEFLLNNQLITLADLTRAEALVLQRDRLGLAAETRSRLQYKRRT
jgi:hypothetical protein